MSVTLLISLTLRNMQRVAFVFESVSNFSVSGTGVLSSMRVIITVCDTPG